jgi:hypothetical protein
MIIKHIKIIYYDKVMNNNELLEEIKNLKK